MKQHEWWGYLHEMGGFCIIPADDEQRIAASRKRDTIVAEVKPFKAENTNEAFEVLKTKIAVLNPEILDITNMWWGYQHYKLNSLHVKRFFNRTELRARKCSQFIKHIVGPFKASNEKEALLKLKKELKKEVNNGVVTQRNY